MRIIRGESVTDKRLGFDDKFHDLLKMHCGLLLQFKLVLVWHLYPQHIFTFYDGLEIFLLSSNTNPTLAMT